jgi:hypothetical protein
MAFKLIAQAVKGDMHAAKEILDRVEGKVRKPIAMSGEGGGPVEAHCITVQFVDANNNTVGRL